MLSGIMNPGYWFPSSDCHFLRVNPSIHEALAGDKRLLLAAALAYLKAFPSR